MELNNGRFMRAVILFLLFVGFDFAYASCVDIFAENYKAALYDAEQGYAYIKRFQLEQSAKRMSFVGESQLSKLYVLSDQAYPRFEVTMGEGDSFRDPFIVEVEEFIAAKSYKAKGKRITTWHVEKVTEVEPLRFPEPEAITDPEGEDVSAEESVNVETPVNEVNDTDDISNIEIVTVDTTKEEPAEPKADADEKTDVIDEITGQMRLF
jgi:topoisomerase-4 subunit A